MYQFLLLNDSGAYYMDRPDQPQRTYLALTKKPAFAGSSATL
jgi:hypothetical protein